MPLSDISYENISNKKTIYHPDNPSNSPLSTFRHILLIFLALLAYLASTFGFGDNFVYLFLAFASVLTVLPIIKANFYLNFSLISLLVAVLVGGYINGYVPALRSATPYLGLIVIFSLLSMRTLNNRRKTEGITLLYTVGFFQVIVYVIQAGASPSYSFLHSLDEYQRLSLGWVPIVAFFHFLLPRKIKNEHRDIQRFLGFSLCIVPLLVIFNTSRSELLITALLTVIALYIRSRLLFLGALLLAVVILVNFSESISSIKRASRSIEEVFTTDHHTLSDSYTNYRSFENLMMVERILSSGPIGCGLGCEVPFPTQMVLNDREYDGVTVFHNGYLATVLHFGIIGVALILIMIWKLARSWLLITKVRQHRNRTDVSSLNGEGLRLAVLVVLVGTGFTTGGFMSSYDVLVLILPLCSAIGMADRKNKIVRASTSPLREKSNIRSTIC